MENKIHHFIHGHPLSLREIEIHMPCLLCQQVTSSVEIYSCCSMFCSSHNYIHKSCSKLPQQMLHPFHPQHSLALRIEPPNASVSFKCGACGPIPRSSNYYHCSDCGFNLDACCASLMPTTKTKSSKVQEHHLGHPHPLILCDNDTIFSFPCSGCTLPIDGSGIYVCLHCNCLLDESCAEWPSEIQHSLHPPHPLTVLVHQTSGRCRACGKFLGGGFAFHCSECDFSLDACCASLEPNPQNHSQGSSDEFQLQVQVQLSHPHPLIPCQKKNRFPFSCDACQLPFEEEDDSSALVYVCLECKYLLHKSCADLPLEVKHSFCHQQHTLSLIEYSIRQSEDPFKEKQLIRPLSSGKAHEFKGELQCRACEEFGSGFAYLCLECEIFFDIRCPVSKPTLIESEYELHPHPLALFSVKPSSLMCTVCNFAIYTPFFRCVECKFNLHVYCLTTLPPTAKDKHHRHRLNLIDSPITDYPHENRFSEFYCDSCEEKRGLLERTYYCEECHYVAHVHCQLSEILPILEEKRSLACKVGEKKLDIVEEGVELESLAGVDKVDMVISSVSTDNARVPEYSFLIEVDEEIDVIRSDVECLAAELKEMEEILRGYLINRINSVRFSNSMN